MFLESSSELVVSFASCYTNIGCLRLCDTSKWAFRQIILSLLHLGWLHKSIGPREIGFAGQWNIWWASCGLWIHAGHELGTVRPVRLLFPHISQTDQSFWIANMGKETAHTPRCCRIEPSFYYAIYSGLLWHELKRQSMVTSNFWVVYRRNLNSID